MIGLKIKKRKVNNEKYLLLRENESITILADSELKSSINIMCKNQKLLVEFIENDKKLSNNNQKTFEEA